MTTENQGQAEYGNAPKSSAVKTAVLIPCHNEEITIGKVIDDFWHELPSAAIYVFDNCSTDATAVISVGHGAVVIKEPCRGKGFVVESMFDCVDAGLILLSSGRSFLGILAHVINWRFRELHNVLFCGLRFGMKLVG